MNLINFNSHIRSMKNNRRSLSGFNFSFNRHNYSVVLSIAENDLKEDIKAIGWIRIFKENNLDRSFNCFIWEKWMKVAKHNPNIYEFFEINTENTKGNHFKENVINILSCMESSISPFFKERVSESADKAVLKVVCENDPMDPNKNYCTSVRLNGFKKNGERAKRKPYNDEKARRLRPVLYGVFGKYYEVSFCFSTDKEKEVDDYKIIQNYNENNGTKLSL